MNESNFVKEVNLYYIKSKFNDLFLNLSNRLIKENFNLLVVTNSIQENDELDQFLWVKNKESFIPHRRFSDPYYKKEKIMLFSGIQEEIKSYHGFDILIFSPNVKVKKVLDFKKLFLFSYMENKNIISLHKRKLQKSRFKVKTLIEKQNQMWEVS